MPTYSSTVSERPSQTLWVSDLTKSCYKDDQQVKFQHLQAEIDSLLEQLQNLNEERLVTEYPEE
jgi:hypothetical protein